MIGTGVQSKLRYDKSPSTANSFLYFATDSSKIISLGKLSNSIKTLIKNNLSQYHVPKIIQNFNNLPKTKSGKIMRRIMRDVAINGRIDDSIDYSTLVNKEKFLRSLNQLLDEDFHSI